VLTLGDGEMVDTISFGNAGNRQLLVSIKIKENRAPFALPEPDD
jgi:hypothetical protein